MEVNYFGVLSMTRAFAPLLGANGGGYIVNVLSVAGAFPAPFMGGYSPAKAAALFLSSITRSELADQGTEVIALIVGSVDTRMAAHVQGRKEDPRDVVRAGLDALDRGEHVADTDFMAIDARARYARDPIRYERGMTKLLKATVMDTGR
jgi:short-subunit dehydrogenase